MPRSFKASIKAMYEKLAATSPQLFEDAIKRDLRSKRGTTAFHHVQLAAHYLDGKPADTVKLGNDDGPLLVVVGDDRDDD